MLVLPPVVFYVLLLGVARFLPAFPGWSELPVFQAMPAMLLVAAAVLGLCFTQTRITFSSMIMSTALLGANRVGAFPVEDPMSARLLFWSGILLPIALAVFHRLRERGVWSAFGAVRVAVTALTCGFLALLPRLSGWPGEAMLVSTAPWLLLPPVVLIVSAIAIPLMFLPRAFEGRALGPLMATSVLCALTALNGRATLWPADREYGVLLLFMSAAGLLLVIAVLDSAWRKANMDELTQLPARHALKHHLARLGQAYTVGLIDIDHFKQINDRHGHAAGDQVLRYVASRLQQHAPGRTYRYGGEEFAIICEGDRAEAHIVAIEAARRAIGRESFRLRGRGRPRKKPESPLPQTKQKTLALRITASAGVATAHGKTDPQEVIKAADQALYRAKKLGRDRLCRAGRG